MFRSRKTKAGACRGVRDASESTGKRSSSASGPSAAVTIDAPTAKFRRTRLVSSTSLGLSSTIKMTGEPRSTETPQNGKPKNPQLEKPSVDITPDADQTRDCARCPPCESAKRNAFSRQKTGLDEKRRNAKPVPNAAHDLTWPLQRSAHWLQFSGTHPICALESSSSHSLGSISLFPLSVSLYHNSIIAVAVYAEPTVILRRRIWKYAILPRDGKDHGHRSGNFRRGVFGEPARKPRAAAACPQCGGRFGRRILLLCPFRPGSARAGLRLPAGLSDRALHQRSDHGNLALWRVPVAAVLRSALFGRRIPLHRHD